MFLDTFLRRHRLTPGDLAAAVREHLAPAGGEACYVTGSLVEGLGNGRSDIDVYLVTDRDLSDRLLSGKVAILPLGSAALDLEVLSRARVETLLERLAQFPSDQARDHRISALAFSQPELKFLHNLAIGTALVNERAHRGLVSRVDARAIARIHFDYSLAWADTLHTDLLGLLEERDHASARYLLASFAGHVAAMFLAATGNTNPAEKWRVRKLAALAQSGADERLPGGRDVASTAAAFESLCVSCEANGPAVRAQFARMLRIAYAVIPWGQRRFLSGEPLAPKRNGERRALPDRHGGSAGSDEILRPLTPGCRIRYADGAYTLTDADTPMVLTFNELAYELLLQFDGTITTCDAVSRLAAITDASPVDVASSVRDLQLVLESRGLTQLLAGGDPV
jgi:hypothetical protein